MSRRPGARFNRGRVVTAAGSAGTAPLGDATWASGVYLDLRDVAYDGIALQGDALVTALTPRVGSGTFAPHNGPTWDVATIGTRRTLKFVAATIQALDAGTWLGNLMNGTAKPLTLIVRNQLDANGTKVMWGFGNSVQASKDFVEGVTSSTNGAMSGRQTDDAAVSAAPTAGVNLTFVPRVAAWVFDGTQLYQYTDVAGVMTLSAGFPKACSVGNIVTNQFRFGSTGRSTYGFPTEGHMQCLAITSQLLSQAQLQTVYNAWIADDAPASVGTKIGWYGDSKVKGSFDSGEGGYRRYVYNNCVANAKSVDFQGSLSNGTFPEAQHSGYSSFEILQVNNRITLELGTGGVYGPKYIVLDCGTNDLNNGGTPVPQALTDITTTINNAHTKITQIDATGRIILLNQIDQLGFTSETNSFNAGLPAIVATFNAANPGNQIILVDINSVIGAASGNPYYANDAHLNSTGYAVEGNYIYTNVLGPLLP